MAKKLKEEEEEREIKKERRFVFRTKKERKFEQKKSKHKNSPIKGDDNNISQTSSNT
jgi:hypothetical protein